MRHNGLNTISEPISAKSPLPMDPHNRVPPHARAVPDWESDAGRRRNSVPDRAAAEARVVIERAYDERSDETPVDELIRELERDLEDDLVAGGSIGAAERSEPSDNFGVSENDYATVGVRNLEWRLPIIRSAAHRSADAIASIQLVDPSESQEEQLTKIVLSTYRLIDPRFRGSYFQQVRVGRTLPIVLQTASCIDGTPLSLQPTLESGFTSCVRLFGHSIAVKAGASTATFARSAGSDEALRRSSFPQISTQATRHRKHGAAARSNFRTEAIEVFAELQSRSHPAEWTQWFRGTRLIATLSMVTCVFVAIIAAYRTAIPLRTPIASEQRLTQKNSSLTSSQQPVGTDRTASASLPRSVSLQASSAPSQGSPVPTPSPRTTLPEPPFAYPLDPDGTVSETESLPAVADHETTQAELMASLARIRGMSDVDLLNSNTSKSSELATPVIPSATSELQSPDILSPAPPPSIESMPAQPNEPSLLSPPDSIPPDEALIAAALLKLWSETESATQKFTDASAADLIEGWDVIADLSVQGSAEHMAANRLASQASWLIYPFAKIVARLRSSDASLSPRLPGPAATDLQDTSNLNADEVQRLFSSWQAARTRVVRTSDLNQMLRQANILLDRIIISDQLSSSDRSNFLAIIRNDVEKLARICSDEAATADTSSLLTAIATLPAASEWDRLASAEHPSGMMASIYCLHQRRWDQGIAWLGQAGNPAVAAVAKAEWKQIQAKEIDALDNTDAAARESLANRWSKIADRLEPREAAAVRLHAIELYGDQPDTESQQNLLRAQLPLYLQ